MQKGTVHLAWGKGTKNDLLCDHGGIAFVFLYLIFVIVVFWGRNELIRELQAAATILFLELGAKREAFYMDLDVWRRNDSLLGSWINNETPVSAFRH